MAIKKSNKIPSILKRLVAQLKAKGFSVGAATAIATKSLQKSGNLKKGSRTATKKGSKRGKMTPGQRAKDRAVKRRGGKASELTFNRKSNSVRKKKKK